MTKQKCLNYLSKEIAKLEGKKSEVSIGNIREVIKCIGVLCWRNEYEFSTALNEYIELSNPIKYKVSRKKVSKK